MQRERKRKNSRKNKRRRPFLYPTIPPAVVYLYTKSALSSLNGCGHTFYEKDLRNYGRMDERTESRTDVKGTYEKKKYGLRRWAFIDKIKFIHKTHMQTFSFPRKAPKIYGLSAALNDLINSQISREM